MKISGLRSNLTDRNIVALPLAPEHQYIVRDAEQAGFFLLVGSRSKTFMIQADLRVPGGRETIRMKVGGVGKVNAREARSMARALLGRIASGIDPRTPKPVCSPEPKSATSPTLREAWGRYRDLHMLRKMRSPTTVKTYADHIERLLACWLDRPLQELGDDPRIVADRHNDMTRQNGPAIANSAMRSFRAVYNHARKTCRSLPSDNPASSVDWNPEKRRDSAMGLADLPAWFEQLAAIPNPIRRDFQLLLLLSGSRPDALKHVRLEHISFSERTLHLPKPKGGADKAFDIPLSRPMLHAIFRLRRLGSIIYPEAAATWLFPSQSPSGHLEEHKQARAVLSHWGNDLRQTFRTIGQSAGISEMDMHLLMNHSLPGVNAGYITRAKLMRDHLRQQQDKISSTIIGRVVGSGRRPSDQLSQWLNSTSREQMAELLGADPDVIRARCGSRSALRRLEVQAARVVAQNLSASTLGPPSRRARAEA